MKSEKQEQEFNQLQKESEFQRFVRGAKRMIDGTCAHATSISNESDLPDLIGTSIGPYSLVKILGEGGMGIVYAAEQQQPVQRQVALKVIKPGMDSREVIQRFQSERQALALMDHPSIASVIDAGATDSGLPFFVMEMINGESITKYCDAHNCSIKQRVELFAQVCRAVQHAHQKGVIHRDLKPSNVMITLHDDLPVPKVIDFGVAKAVDQRLSAGTVYTQASQIVGTPLYMSPEQAGTKGLDIDTRSDIYSLGVMLYELLCGSTPFTRQQFEGVEFGEIGRTIQESDPPRPSDRVSTLEASVQSTISSQRKLPQGKLAQTLRGDLDWIVMKALEKDRDRRYETAAAFADDLVRFVNNDPVSARPPSPTYRIKKYIRKHRSAFIAASLIMATLILGLIGTGAGMYAAQNRAAGERAAKELALQRLSQVNQRNEILGNIFVDLDAREETKEPKPLKAVLSERLVSASQAIMNDESADDSDSLAQLQFKMGNSLINLGFPNDAIPILEDSFERRIDLLGSDHAKTLTTMNSLITALTEAGQWDEAGILCREMVKMSSNDASDSLTAMHSLGVSMKQSGETAKAIPILEETLLQRESLLGENNDRTLTTANVLGATYQDAGDYPNAIRLLERVYQGRSLILGEEHMDSITSLGNLAGAYKASGNLLKSLSLNELAFGQMKQTLGEKHPRTLTMMNNLAESYSEAGDLEKSILMLEKTAELFAEKLGDDHPSSMVVKSNLAGKYFRLENYDRAINSYEEVLAASTKKMGPTHPYTLSFLGNLAIVYEANGDYEKSLPLMKEAYELKSEKYGPDHPKTISAKAKLGNAYYLIDDLEQAIPLLEDSIAESKIKIGADHPDLIIAYNNLGQAYGEADSLDRSIEMFEEAVRIANLKLKPDQPRSLKVKKHLANALSSSGDSKRAIELLREVVELQETAKPDSWQLFDDYSDLGAALMRADDLEAAEDYLVRGYQGLASIRDSIPKSKVAVLKEALDRVIEWMEQTDRDEEAGTYRGLRDALEATQSN